MVSYFPSIGISLIGAISFMVYCRIVKNGYTLNQHMKITTYLETVLVSRCSSYFLE